MSWKYRSDEITTLGPRDQYLGAVESLTEARVVTHADSGKTFLLSLAGGFAVTLPTPAIGVHLKFITGVIPTTAYTITATGAHVHGGINELEVDTGDDGPYATGATTTTFVASALGTIGDFVEFLGDGSRWLINGQTKLDGAITFA